MSAIAEWCTSAGVGARSCVPASAAASVAAAAAEPLRQPVPRQQPPVPQRQRLARGCGGNRGRSNASTKRRPRSNRRHCKSPPVIGMLLPATSAALSWMTPTAAATNATLPVLRPFDHRIDFCPRVLLGVNSLSKRAPKIPPCAMSKSLAFFSKV